MASAAEARKHPTTARETEPPLTAISSKDPLWESMMDRLRTHMQDREGLYRRLAR